MYFLVSQTMAEYGSITARLAAACDRVEAYIGAGNLKYVILGILLLIALLFLFRRR